MKLFIEYKNENTEIIWCATGVNLITDSKYGRMILWVENGISQMRNLDYIKSFKIS